MRIRYKVFTDYVDNLEVKLNDYAEAGWDIKKMDFHLDGHGSRRVTVVVWRNEGEN